LLRSHEQDHLGTWNTILVKVKPPKEGLVSSACDRLQSLSNKLVEQGEMGHEKKTILRIYL